MWLQAEARERFLTSFPASWVHRDLFNAAFVSCWSELNEDQQDELIRSIELALTSQDIAEVTQTLLNLAEFMEHSDKVSFPSIVPVDGGRKPAGRRGKQEHSPLLRVPHLPYSCAFL